MQKAAREATKAAKARSKAFRKQARQLARAQDTAKHA
jgi:hypothetical protein